MKYRTRLTLSLLSALTLPAAIWIGTYNRVLAESRTQDRDVRVEEASDFIEIYKKSDILSQAKGLPVYLAARAILRREEDLERSVRTYEISHAKQRN